MKSTVTPLRGRRVLLVEDNAINRAIARSFLESASAPAACRGIYQSPST
ncbi:hypothetical protein AAAX56_09950 [Hominicoprocola fusiformis]